MMRRLSPAVLAILALAGCAAFSDDGGTGGDAVEPGAAPEDARVFASFYPLQYVVEEIAGDRLEVEAITPPGVDPHSLELSPRAVADLEGATLVVYLSGFQAAVDEAVTVTGARAFDAAEHAGLRAGGNHAHEEDGGADDHAHGGADEDDHGRGGADEDDHAHGGADEDDHAHDGDHGDHDHGPLDPHFWLDPQRLAAVAAALTEELTALDPDGAAAYEQNLEHLTADLTRLDRDLTTGLADCQRDTVVVAHEAYGYLLEEHGIRQEGLSGLDPDAEPSPARLAEIADVVATHDVDTIFTESLVSPRVVDALARDLGVRTTVLDPLENQQDPAADYPDVMRANLTALQDALGCATP